MGLLVSLPLEDWEMRSATADALRYTHSEPMRGAPFFRDQESEKLEYYSALHRRNSGRPWIVP